MRLFRLCVILSEFRIFTQAIHHRSNVFGSLFAYKLRYEERECEYRLLQLSCSLQVVW